MRKENRVKKSVSFLAAAALSVALIGSQVPVVFAAEGGIESASGIKMEDLFPDNITVSDSMSLSEVGLPENKYGKLKWLDDSIELTERVQSCEVLFVPEEGIDLTDMKGWDRELGGVVSEIHVIVSSIEAEDEEEISAELEETAEGEDPEGISQEAVSENTEEFSGTEEIQEDERDDNPGEDAGDSDGGKSAAEVSDKEDGETSSEDSSDIEDIENTQISENEDNTEDKNGRGDEEITEDKGNSGDKEDITNKEDIEDDQPDTEETETPEDSSEDNNIFDNPYDFGEEDERPTELPENLTEEEKLQQAAVNHSYEGISVSGINLPWYVQFRVTSGESYEFANESDAMIFRSYEFELWDLQNNTEYEIPDGEYISVTVPVKEGYDYTIEHLLDNGASETIIPSVEGSMLIFSTHSFSPFGIAGSKQLVGPDFPIDDVRPSGTPTPTPSITGTPGNSGNGSGGTGNNNGAGGNGSTGSNGTGGNGASDNNGGSTDPGNNGAGGNGSDGNNSGTGTNNGVLDNDGSGAANQNGTNGNNGSTGNSTNNQNNGQSSNRNIVNTGDTTMILPFVACALAAIILIGVIAYMKTKKK